MSICLRKYCAKDIVESSFINQTGRKGFGILEDRRQKQSMKSSIYSENVKLVDVRKFN